jgi:hypothetical protein
VCPEIVVQKPNRQANENFAPITRAMANTCTKEICDKLIELMSRGYTQDEVCAEVGVSLTSFRNWRTKGGPHYEEDFAKAYEKAKLKQFSWWARRGRDNIGEGGFQHGSLCAFHGEYVQVA